jgi:hypothetical protein
MVFLSPIDGVPFSYRWCSFLLAFLVPLGLTMPLKVIKELKGLKVILYKG